MSKKIKLTNQRDLLLEYVQNNHSHPTVDDIFMHLREKLPHISKKTVYNNLELLCEKGMIQEIYTSGVKRYEPVRKPHHHIYCQVCGSILDMEHQKLTKMAQDVATQIKDFEVVSTTTHFYGICKKCKE